MKTDTEPFTSLLNDKEFVSMIESKQKEVLSDQGDKLIRAYESCGAYGEWLMKREYKDKEGNSYTVCTDQDGGDWIEE